MDIKNVLIVAFGNTGNEPEAIRQSLECFNCFVAIKYIGRPNDFIDILNDKLSFEFDCIILSCHGNSGNIIMPVLADEVYEKDEPKGEFSNFEITKYNNLCDKLIISSGCTTGYKETANAFHKNSNIYIAPIDYIDGNAALFFIIRFFYEISQNKQRMYDAYNKAKQSDDETTLFSYFE
ncbi:MAG: delta-aminolevulinic acid dehydratase [Clostridiales bacterium]|jgi:hypothetical protein|nr:delta-aminolevulinic acid dehydratase [Clostridiales bacterium]